MFQQAAIDWFYYMVMYTRELTSTVHTLECEETLINFRTYMPFNIRTEYET